MGGSLAETPILEEGTKIMHSLNLASDISMNYVVSKADLEGYDSFYLQCDIPQYEGNVFVGTLRKVLPAVEKGDFCYFTLEGLTAVQIPDRIEAVLYMDKDGRSHYSNTDVYSVAQYAYGQMGKSNASQELKTLCAELLRYGACAQTYKDYRTDFFADKALTQEQTALLAELDTVEFGSTNRTLSDLDSPVAQWVGKALILDSKVTLRYVVEPRTDAEDISVQVRYLDCEGAEQTVILTEGKPYGNKAGCYSFDLDCLLAAELRTVLSAAVYAGETRISNTLEYSIDTYGKGKTGDLGTLCKALLAYSDAAKTFFAN